MSPLSSILQTLFPSCCACCDEVLTFGERQICIRCLSDLEETNYSAVPDNPVERRLMGRFPFEAATAIYKFKEDNTVRNAVHAMKFHACDELCLIMGRLMGLELLHSGRFDDVDLLVPVPLHWLRRLHRGYNQSELLCRGMAEVMHRPVECGSLKRHRYTRQQSLQRSANRTDNVADAFRVRRPDRLAGKHILLVDDVLTTGATLTACADALVGIPGLHISVATFCTVL